VVLGLGGSGAIRAQSQGSMNLRLRRGNDGVELVIEGVGDQPVLQQRLNGQVWEGSLRTQGAPGVRNGQVRLTDPATGIQSATLVGSGSSYALKITPSPGRPLQDPVVSADGRDLILKFPGLVVSPALQTGRLNLNTPGRVPQKQYAPPLRPRAVAPPLGDMAVGTMVLQNRSYVNVSGPPVTLTLNNAPAKDALMALARLGGYGFVYVADRNNTNQSKKNGEQSSGALLSGKSSLRASIFFENEPYQSALNSLLISSGLEGRLKGKTLFVGKSLSKVSFGSSVSKIVRMNQVKSDAAAEYLSTLGAEFCNTVLPGQYESQTDSEYSYGSSFDVGGSSGSVSGSGDSGSKSKGDFSPGETEIQCYGKDDSSGPLYGLAGTNDKRLNTITLIGESRLVSVAQQYLKTLDLRKRQVAIKVQILNIDLKNDKNIDSSFSARIGNTFLVSESGRAFMNFGDYKPGGRAGSGVLGEKTGYVAPGAYSAGVPQVASQEVLAPVVPALQDAYTIVNSETGQATLVEVPYIDPVTKQKVYVPNPNPNAPSDIVTRIDADGRPIYVQSQDPEKFSYPKNSFYGYLEAVISSTSAKTLASPTLLVQEGSGARIVTGTSVITDASETIANNQTNISTKRETAGLLLNVDVERIDDNGFISLSIDPTVSIPRPSGSVVGNIQLFNIEKRSLNSGLIRLRDRQTLVLTGVIQDSDREVVTKWPVLGDLPFIGQLFRASNSQRDKQELVVLVTPYIVDDNNGGSYGYGYRPSTQESRRLMGSR
jgi:type IV pilus assembly protein PilQ